MSLCIRVTMYMPLVIRQQKKLSAAAVCTNLLWYSINLSSQYILFHDVVMCVPLLQVMD